MGAASAKGIKTGQVGLKASGKGIVLAGKDSRDVALAGGEKIGPWGRDLVMKDLDAAKQALTATGAGSRYVAGTEAIQPARRLVEGSLNGVRAGELSEVAVPFAAVATSVGVSVLVPAGT